MKLLVVAWKDLVLVLRDRAALLFLVLVPVVVITVIAFSLAGSDSGHLLLPVVDEDGGPVAGVLVESLSKHADVRRVDRAEAERLVAGDKVAAAAIVVPRRTSKNYLGGRPSTLTLLTDPVKGIEVNAVKAFLMLAGREAEEIADPLFEELLELEERNITGSRKSIPPFEQHVPGFSVMFVMMGVLFGVAYGLRDERDWGTWSRMSSAPISRASFIGGKLLARFVLGFTQLLGLFVYGHFVFDISLGPSLFAMWLVIAAVVFSMTGFSLLVTGFARTREQIIPLGLTMVMIVCALGGCWWPLYQEPDWLQRTARLTLTAWSMEALHDLILRDRGLLEVARGIGALVVYGGVCGAAGLWLEGRRDEGAGGR